MYATAYNLWTFTWFVHFELPFRLEGTDKIHTERLSKFHSNIYSILFAYVATTTIQHSVEIKLFIYLLIKYFP